MGLANRITLFRIAMAPVFAALFSVWAAGRDPLWLPLIWGLFLVSEFSDILDGWVARKFHQTTDLGKLLDPFSDVVSRLTIFLCLLLVNLVPLWFFLVVLYRELGMTFLRTLIIQRGVVQAASKGGKIKAGLYFVVSLAGLVAATWPDLAASAPWFWGFGTVLVLAAAQSVFSFVQYLVGYVKLAPAGK